MAKMGIKASSELMITETGKVYLLIRTTASGHVVQHVELPLIPGLPPEIEKEIEAANKRREEASKKMQAEKDAQYKLNKVAQDAAEKFDQDKGSFVSKKVAEARKKMGL